MAELLGRWPEAASRRASRGAEMRMDSEDFRADYERLRTGPGQREVQTGLNDENVKSLGLEPIQPNGTQSWDLK
jgi:hypothetical protein